MLLVTQLAKQELSLSSECAQFLWQHVSMLLIMACELAGTCFDKAADIDARQV